MNTIFNSSTYTYMIYLYGFGIFLSSSSFNSVEYFFMLILNTYSDLFLYNIIHLIISYVDHVFNIKIKRESNMLTGYLAGCNS